MKRTGSQPFHHATAMRGCVSIQPPLGINANLNIFFPGGRISIFQHILPTIGPGALTNREAAANSSGGDAKNKDTSLLGPSTGTRVSRSRYKLFLSSWFKYKRWKPTLPLHFRLLQEACIGLLWSADRRRFIRPGLSVHGRCNPQVWSSTHFLLC